MAINLSPDQENVNITRGIPRDGFYWVFANLETESPEAYTEEEAKNTDFVLEYQHETVPLEFRRKDKQFLYFKAEIDSVERDNKFGIGKPPNKRPDI